MRRSIKILTCFLLLPMLVSAQEAKMNISFDKDEIKIGEQITAVLKLEFPVSENVPFPILDKSIAEKVEIIEVGKIDTSYHSNLSYKVLSSNVLLTSFDTGYHAIPPISLKYKDDSLRTEAQLIHVVAVEVELNENASQGELEIKDIKNVWYVPFSLLEWFKENWVYFAVAALLLILIWVYFKYLQPMLVKKNGGVIPLKKVVPHHITILKKLSDLEGQKLWQNGKVKEYQSQVSEIIRLYIELRFKSPALESTTHEIIDSISNEGFSQQQVDDLTDLLNLADLVKFAKHQPLPNEHELSMKKAVGFVNSTIPEENMENQTITEQENV